MAAGAGKPMVILIGCGRRGAQSRDAGKRSFMLPLPLAYNRSQVLSSPGKCLCVLLPSAVSWAVRPPLSSVKHIASTVHQSHHASCAPSSGAFTSILPHRLSSAVAPRPSTSRPPHSLPFPTACSEPPPQRASPCSRRSFVRSSPSPSRMTLWAGGCPTPTRLFPTHTRR